MNFIFWQNVISIHQSAFIKSLAENHNVTLAVEEDLNSLRISDGWEVPDMGNAIITVNPSYDTIKRLLSIENGKHVFSGIDAFPMPSKVFKMAIEKRCDISVMMEPYDPRGLKGMLRQLKYKYLAFRFGHSIKRMFITGRQGEIAYRKSGFDNIFQWGYFTETPTNDQITQTNYHKYPQLLFIGRINQRKNILPLATWLKNHQNSFESFYIIGTGVLENELSRLTKNSKKIKYLGAVPNKHIGQYLKSSDILIIPSLYDGWAAVVNEALLCGTRVICSDRCGAEILIDQEWKRGHVFALKDMGQVMEEELKRPPLSRQQREDIAKWAENNISGKAAAKYFTECFTYSHTKPVAPWVS